MFTGIIIERGEVRKAQKRNGLLKLELLAPRIAKELHKGDSVSVNGVCLTAIETGRRRFATEAMEETLARSTLGALKKGGSVNLELPVRLADRLGGHLVQGHVDGIATVTRIEEEAAAKRIWFKAGNDLLRYLVPKGSVALDGVALTVVEVGAATFQVALIPHTLDITTLDAVEVGSTVNVEVDLIAKYVERLAGPQIGAVQ
jgi:riboflavin synthase